MGDIQEEIREILNSLKGLESFACDECMELMKQLCSVYWEHEESRGVICDVLTDENSEEIFMKALLELSGKGLMKDNSVWFPAYYVLNAVWNFSDASLQLAKALGKVGLIKYLLTILKHEPYRERFKQQNVHYLLKASLSILHNVAKAPANRQLFRSENAMETVIPYMSIKDNFLKVVAIMLLGYIIDESEAELIMDKSNAISIMVGMLNKAIENGRYKGFTAEELTEALSLIATSEKNKQKIHDEGAVPIMVQLMRSGKSKEQRFAAKVVWQISFDEEIRTVLQKDEELLQQLEELSSSQDKDVAAVAEGALWVINNKGSEKSRQNQAVKDGGACTNHIMISYQWDYQAVLIQVKDRLKSQGFRVWMDVEQMEGSTLQAMAEAVENAAVVLVCCSQKYKESPSCRTEAEYTFQLHKPVIPLMMERKYRPDGWLGIIVGAKLWMDFGTNTNFEQNFNKLVKELHGRGRDSEGDTMDGPVKAAASSSLSATLVQPRGAAIEKLQAWGSTDVARWLTESGLESCLALFSSYDGRLLLRLLEIRKESPEFFFRSLKRDMGFSSMREILIFVDAVEKLEL
ncbi:uncharacterized protein LOC116942174 [Petromyzon marinus]|uniref:Uncharacterized protein LOC116942174 n=1 Tax=Petromyzon marinus TaxID=7757 RepID=A0AAJ7T1T1_PETMA|nr:uncharacterized protein LOC116942174 [Petromyzon marinus]